MKKISILLLAFLLVVGLAACRRTENIAPEEPIEICEDLQAYKRLIEQMRNLSEYMVHVSVEIEAGAALRPYLPPSEEEEIEVVYPSHIQMSATLSTREQTALVDYTQQCTEGAPPRYRSRIFTREAMYLDLSSFIVDSFLGEGRYVRASYDQIGGGNFSDMFTYLPKMPTETQAFSREGEVFTVTIEGEDAVEMIEGLGAMFVSFAQTENEETPIGNFFKVLLAQIGQEVVSEIQIRIASEERKGGFRQSIELYIPELITMTMLSTYTLKFADAVHAPGEFFYWDDWKDVSPTLGWAAWRRTPRNTSLEPLEVIYDLEELNLTGHLLTAGSSFEGEIYESVRGNYHTVLRPREGVGDPPGLITHDGLRLGFSSYGTSPMLAVDAVVFLQEVVRIVDQRQPALVSGPIHANADRTIAFVAVRQLVILEEMSRFFMVQTMPDSDEMVFLEFWLWTIHADSLSTQRHGAVFELGQHVGVDFLAFLDGNSAFAEELARLG